MCEIGVPLEMIDSNEHVFTLDCTISFVIGSGQNVRSNKLAFCNVGVKRIVRMKYCHLSQVSEF